MRVTIIYDCKLDIKKGLKTPREKLNALQASIHEAYRAGEMKMRVFKADFTLLHAKYF